MFLNNIHAPTQNIEPNSILLPGELTYSQKILSDEYLTPQAAPLTSPRNAEPGPGTLTRFADTGNNASIAGGEFVIGAVVGDLDPAYYYNVIDRVANRALVVYAQGAAWVGWSNSATLATNALVYGARERSAYEAGVEKSEALAIGDPAHIIILRPTGALHVCRVGLTEYLCWVYRNDNTASLYPAILGSVCNYDVVDVYDVDAISPTSELATPALNDTFATPLATFLLEVTITTRSGSADTRIAVGYQDASNNLFINISPAGALQLYRRVAGTATIEKSIFGNGVVVNGSRIVIQFTVPSQLVSGGGNNFKVWCGSSYYDSTLGGTAQGILNANSGGVVTAKPADCTLNNLACWSITL